MNRNRLSHSVVAAAVLGCIGNQHGVFAQGYEIIDLGTLGGPSSAAWAINDTGHIVGSSTTADAAVHAFMWKGLITDIGPLEGDAHAQAFDINNDGDVAVMSFGLGDRVTKGMVWNPSSTTDLGGLAARGINTGSLVVGHIDVSAPDGWILQHAAKWDAGVLTPLGTLGGDFSDAFAANDLGETVGMSWLEGNRYWHAMLHRSGIAFDLGTLGGENSQAFDINNLRQVVGVADTAGGQPHAFLFQVNEAGAVTSRFNLGTLDGRSSYAHAINENGVVVGTSGFRAFKWESGVMTDLNSLLPPNSGWVLEVANGINLEGSIVGQGRHQGLSRAFLLSVTSVCVPTDADHDGDVDLRDFSAFLTEFEGPGAP